jgi:hypothetical protein
MHYQRIVTKRIHQALGRGIKRKKGRKNKGQERKKVAIVRRRRMG